VRRLLVFVIVFSVFAEENPLDYYRIHFEEKEEHLLADTLFEKTVWKRKVSHILLDSSGDLYRVTLLMILEYPHNYRSQNYPLYYEFESIGPAMEKLKWLDSFLERRGVMRVAVLGNKITSETILFSGYDFIPEQRAMQESKE